MSSWKCFSCGKKVDDIKTIKCPYCGFRIYTKDRPPVVKKVKTD